MKSSNIKRKMSSFTYSACALCLFGGMFVSCQDELLTGTPSWLGSSIYDELEKRGNFKTTLSLINDGDVSTVDNNGETEYAKVLRRTGSKTLFVANDNAYTEFFRNNKWGVSSYAELTPAQKKMLFNSSMINSAYLIELMSNVPATSDDGMPIEGSCMRRNTALSLYDSIPTMFADQMPDSKLWKKYKDRYEAKNGVGMLIVKDNETSPMVHFLPDFMKSNAITSDDISFLTNGACTSNAESYVNGQKVITENITCQNGYIHQVENVMTPLTNMAEMIANDPDLTIFSKMLNRWSVPVYSEGVTNAYNQFNTSGTIDSVFVMRYLNDGFGQNSGYNTLTSVDVVNYASDANMGLLPFDPGWNRLYNTAMANDMATDMAVIIAPTDDAFERYFADKGKDIITRYGHIDAIPNNIIVKIMDNLMKPSLIATVPSKFGSVTNTAQLVMGLSKADIASCMIANNGVVYKSNKVYTIPEYQSVSFPAELDDNIRIMRYMIKNLNYEAYLNSMESEYMFILPSDKALANYIDPVDFHKNNKTIAEFYYDETSASNPIKVKHYKLVFDEATGDYTKGEEITNYFTSSQYSQYYNENEYVQNRLRDILDNSIIVRDKNAMHTSTKKVYQTKSGMPVIIEGEGVNVKITTPFWTQYPGDHTFGVGVDLKGDPYYTNMGKNPDGNGETFVVDDQPVMSASKSVYDVLQGLVQSGSADAADYEEFLNLLNASSFLQKNYDFTITSSTDPNLKLPKSVSNGKTIKIMDNYNYTIYVPKKAEMEKLYANGILPDWRSFEALNNTLTDLETQIEKFEEGTDEYNALDAEIKALENSIDIKTDSIDKFLRYHIQNKAIYQGAVSSSGLYETSYMNNGRFAILSVKNSGNEGEGAITIQCYSADKSPIAGSVERKVLGGNYFAREFRFRNSTTSSDTGSAVQCSDIKDATRIYNSSTAVIHLIDRPLLYNKELSDKYNEISGY